MPPFPLCHFRLIREITQEHSLALRWRRDALKALHVAAEVYITKILSRANRLATHAGRQTLKVEDLQVIMDLENYED